MELEMTVVLFSVGGEASCLQPSGRVQGLAWSEEGGGGDEWSRCSWLLGLQSPWGLKVQAAGVEVWVG